MLRALLVGLSRMGVVASFCCLGGVISAVDWQSMLMWGPTGGSSGATLAASCRPVTIGQDKPAAHAAWRSDRPMVSWAAGCGRSGVRPIAGNA